MISRRGFVLACAAGLLATAPACPALTAPPVAADPLALVNAVYARVARGKGGGGGAFVIESKAAKTKYLSKALVGLWAKADAHTPKGDVGPVDFDPVTNSQEPDIKSFQAIAEKQEAEKAVIAVTFTAMARRAPNSPITRSATISCATPGNGKSTISAAAAAANRGRSGRC